MKPNTFKNQFQYIMIPRITRVSALEYEKQFKDKVCLVTGATSGIGKAVCKRLLAAGILFFKKMIGAYVIMIGRTLQKIERVLNEFQASKIPMRMDHIIRKNMDFNEPSNVEKDFQKVSPNNLH